MVGRRPVFAPGTGSSVRIVTGFRHPFFPRRFHHRRFWVARSPRWYSPYYFGGYYGSYSYPLYADAYSSYDSASAYYEQNRELAGEVSRLSDQVERLREELEARPVTPPAPSPPSPQSQPATPQAAHESTLLEFRDHHTQEVQNYAVVGQTLWIFDEHRAHKVLLADLDIPATTKLNEERGVDFRLPK